MIDLHIHTTNSDGTDKIKEILKKAEKINLEIISITDHNNCNIYEELKAIDISSLFKGKIIVGCEFSTFFNDTIIEILGYGFDYNSINTFLNKYYDNKYWEKRNIYLGQKLINILIKKGFIIDLDKCVIKKDTYKYYGIKKIFDEIKIHDENIKLMDENIFSSMSAFSRKGLYNPNSSYYLEYNIFLPKLQDIINLIHKNKGKCFLAHPFEYNIDNIALFLKNIYKDYNIDGIECFYTTFTDKQSKYLLDFSKENNLLICGGSDYHGKNKENHNLGIGKGNLNIDKKIIDNWKINYYN